MSRTREEIEAVSEGLMERSNTIGAVIMGAGFELTIEILLDIRDLLQDANKEKR